MARGRLPIANDQLAGFCRRNRIARLSAFGSVLRPDFGPESDIDILVEFEPGARVGLITYGAIESELSQLLGRQVDMHTPDSLSHYIRDSILSTAEVQYVGE